MTPAEAAREAMQDKWRSDPAEYQRLAREREDMTVDASVIRFDDPDREPMMA